MRAVAYNGKGLDSVIGMVPWGTACLEEDWQLHPQCIEMKKWPSLISTTEDMSRSHYRRWTSSVCPLYLTLLTLLLLLVYSEVMNISSYARGKKINYSTQNKELNCQDYTKHCQFAYGIRVLIRRSNKTKATLLWTSALTYLWEGQWEGQTKRDGGD